MTVARSVADVLDQHVVCEVESIDRMYLNVWQPRLAYGGGVAGFFVAHRAGRAQRPQPICSLPAAHRRPRQAAFHDLTQHAHLAA